LKELIKKSLTFNRTNVVGLVLLLASSFMGALLRNSAQITNDPIHQVFRSTCDTYVKGLCIPTAYFSIPFGSLGSIVVNVTSFAVGATFFVLGVLLIRK
jgi:hypothetical protein